MHANCTDPVRANGFPQDEPLRQSLFVVFGSEMLWEFSSSMTSKSLKVCCFEGLTSSWSPLGHVFTSRLMGVVGAPGHRVGQGRQVEQIHVLRDVNLP